MPLVCPRCGAYALNNTERNPNTTTCSACGQSTLANIFPLFIVTGASGSGKSTVVAELRCSHDKSGDVLDKSALYYRSVSSSTLTTTMNRVATGAHERIPQCLAAHRQTFGNKACRPERSEGSGSTDGEILRFAQDDSQRLPWDLDGCEDRGLIGTIHFLNLHCSDEVREQRLRARPSWRQSSNDAFIEEHRKFAHWLLDNANTAYNPTMPTVDTSNSSITEVAATIARWVLTVLQDKPKREPACGSSSA